MVLNNPNFNPFTGPNPINVGSTAAASHISTGSTTATGLSIAPNSIIRSNG